MWCIKEMGPQYHWIAELQSTLGSTNCQWNSRNGKFLRHFYKLLIVWNGLLKSSNQQYFISLEHRQEPYFIRGAPRFKEIDEKPCPYVKYCTWCKITCDKCIVCNFKMFEVLFWVSRMEHFFNHISFQKRLFCKWHKQLEVKKERERKAKKVDKQGSF